MSKFIYFLFYSYNTVLVFGVPLEKADIDPVENVPRFVIECIKIIEKTENLTTNGIYRASGNKNNIELIKKKVCV